MSLSKDQIGYALAKQIVHGDITFSTNYGDVTIEAEYSAPIVEAAIKALELMLVPSARDIEIVRGES